MGLFGKPTGAVQKGLRASMANRTGHGRKKAVQRKKTASRQRKRSGFGLVGYMRKR